MPQSRWVALATLMIVAAMTTVGLVVLGRRTNPIAVRAEVAEEHLEELKAAAARVAAMERRKKELEAEVSRLEGLRTRDVGQTLRALDEGARALHVEIRQIQLSESGLKVVFRAPSEAVARKLVDRLEEQSIVHQPDLTPRDKNTFELQAKS
jgi:hypothetical protein